MNVASAMIDAMDYLQRLWQLTEYVRNTTKSLISMAREGTTSKEMGANHKTMRSHTFSSTWQRSIGYVR
jgi:hypothetical protein